MEDHLHHCGGVEGKPGGGKLPAADLKQPVQQHADGGPTGSTAVLLPAASDDATTISAATAVYAATGSPKTTVGAAKSSPGATILPTRTN